MLKTGYMADHRDRFHQSEREKGKGDHVEKFRTLCSRVYLLFSFGTRRGKPVADRFELVVPRKTSENYPPFSTMAR